MALVYILLYFYHFSEAAKSRIDENRNEYLDLTQFAVTLFFTGNFLSLINHMYQFSLAWFINLFCTSIDVADKSEELEERLCSIKDHFLRHYFLTCCILHTFGFW